MEKYELVNDVVVMYVPASPFPDGILPAFKKLENKLGSPNDRTFFGISWPDQKGKILYKAAVAEKYNGEGNNHELDIFTIRKGIYISELIKEYKKNISQIGVVFQQLLHHPELDTNAYCLEWYNSDDVLCLVKLDPAKEEQTKWQALKAG